MGVYFILLLLVMGLALTELLLNKKWIGWVTGSLLALFAGFRYYAGYDFVSYGVYYERADSIRVLFDGSVRLESGFLFLSTLFSSIGLNYYAFVLFFSLLSLATLSFFLYKYVPYPSMVLAYYYARFFLARDMGQVRGAFAAVILLFSIQFIIKREPIKFLIIVYLASLFHITAYIFVVGYILNILIEKVTIKNSITLLSISTLAGLIVQNPVLYRWAIPSEYFAYFTSPSHASGPWLRYPILWMQLLLLFAMIVFFKKVNLDDDKWIKVMMKLYLISPLVLLASGQLETVGGRISTLFATIEVLLIPYFFMSLSRYKILNIICYIAFTLVVFALIFVISGMYLRYVPYQTIFQSLFI
ncbi:MAG: EpsG family protein [Alkalibacterium sp.]|nr:EpsG family protein [Alkalibacterium sp.]